MKQSPPNDGYGQLEKDPEIFQIQIDTSDGKSKSGLLPAFNKESAMALMDIFRFAMKPTVVGYILSQRNGEIIAAVQAAGYIDAMTMSTSLRGEPPEQQKPKTKLPFWELTKVKPEKAMADAKMFNLKIIIDGAVEDVPVSAVNKESIISLLTQATCERLPRIAGWNLFDDAGTMVASVPAIKFLGDLAEKTGLGNKPADLKSAGWRASPAVAPITEGFAKMMEKAKKEGRIPEGK